MAGASDANGELKTKGRLTSTVILVECLTRLNAHTADTVTRPLERGERADPRHVAT